MTASSRKYTYINLSVVFLLSLMVGLQYQREGVFLQKSVQVSFTERSVSNPAATESFAPSSCLLTPSSCSNFSTFLSSSQRTITAPTNSKQKAAFFKSFPPKFDSGKKYEAEGGLLWHRISGVCMSQADGVLIPPSKSSHIYPRAYNFSAPLRATPYSNFSNETIRFATGRTIISSCWRTRLHKKNPAHYIFGFGKIFSHLVGLASESNSSGKPLSPIDNVILHQCANTFNMDFSIETMKIFWGYGTEIGAFHANTNIVIIPHNDERPEATTYCVENAVFNANIGRSLGDNGKKVVEKFRERVSLHAAKNGMPHLSNFFVNRTDRKMKGPVIKIFQRTSGSSLRKFVNLDEVVSLASEYTGIAVEVIHTDEKIPLWDQISLFNSFDILITPHGSHMTNGIFSLGKTAIVEVVAACFNDDFQRNLKSFGSNYIISVGHTPVRKKYKDRKFLKKCMSQTDDLSCKNKLSSCGVSMIHSDLRININTLRRHLEESLTTLGYSRMSRKRSNSTCNYKSFFRFFCP